LAVLLGLTVGGKELTTTVPLTPDREAASRINWDHFDSKNLPDVTDYSYINLQLEGGE
jgi:hypothetical protein